MHQRKIEEVPPPPPPPNQLLVGWWAWRIAALLVLPAVAQILMNLSDIQERLAQQFATDPGLAGQGQDTVATTARLTPWGLMMAAVVLMLALLVCVAMMRRLGSRAARWAIVVVGVISVPTTGLAYDMGQVTAAGGFAVMDSLAALQVILMVVGTVLVFVRPSTDWLYLAHEYWEFERG